MKSKDLGIVLNRIPYSETSVIVKCFTLEHGLKAFLLQGGKKKYAGILQAFCPIEFTYYQKHEELAKMYEPSALYQLNGTIFDPVKSSYLFFQAEIISQCVKEGQTDKALFEFAINELLWLNEHVHEANYLIYWLIALSEILGFKPNVLSPSQNFDLENGEIGSDNVKHSRCISHPSILKLAEILELEKDYLLTFELDKATRKQLLFTYLEYFKNHISGFKNPQSLEVYQTIWYE